MAQVRDVLNRVEVEQAERRRICHHKRSHHTIEKGQLCLVISEDNGGSKNYCVQCAPDILKRARAKLTDFAAALGIQLM